MDGEAQRDLSSRRSNLIWSLISPDAQSAERSKALTLQAEEREEEVCPEEKKEEETPEDRKHLSSTWKQRQRETFPGWDAGWQTGEASQELFTAGWYF